MRIVALIMAVCAAAVAGADDARPFTVHDLVAMQRIGDAQPSPDGSRAAFTVTTMDLDANRGRSDVWMVPLDGGDPTQLTTNPAGDFSPRWLDDQTLLFLSSRSGSVQVWRLSLAGGEATQVTDLPVGVESLRIGPSGDALYLGLRVFPDCTSGLACTVERLEAEAERKTTGRVYDRLFVRHWDTWKDGLRAHIFRVDLGDDGRATGEALDLMPGIDADCPTFPWGGDGDYVISPDGNHLVYTAKLGGSEVAWTTNWDLFAVPTDGSGEPRRITGFNPAWDHAPAFSPDGTTLYWLAMTRPGYESDRNRVVSMPWPKGPVKVLTEDWDRSPGGIAVSPDGGSLFVSADNVGNHSIFRIDAETGSVEAILTKHSNRDARPLADGRLLFARDSLTSPVELFVRGAEGGEPMQITDLNGGRLAGLRFGDYEQFSFVGAHGDEVFGYLIRPVGFEAGTTYPLAFLVHGGPQGSFDDHWHYRWNPQIYAAHGYATVMIDFHGSTGYGQAFTDAIRGDWGGAPYQDLMMGLDDVLRRHKWIDAERMVALGASYGGYMINWIQGNTDRFAALVCHDGNLDETMAYFDTEELWFPEWEHGGPPWENPKGYSKHSPVSTLPNWSTPELVIHGALDFRVVETQGLGTFNALQRLGVPSRLLYFPDENHWVLKPLNSIQWHEVVLDWIDQWTTVAE